MQSLQELTLELTNWCPSGCLHCSSSSGLKSDKRLNKKIVSQLIKEAAFSGAAKICFGGGEPTSIDTFIPAVKRTVDLGMSAEIFTCGFGRDSKRLTSLPTPLISDCKSLANVKFIFSVHGATSNLHDVITQTPGSFEMLVTSLKRCLDAGIECEINFVPLKFNAHQINEIVEFAKFHGISKLSILRFVPQGRGYKNRKRIELSIDEEDAFITTLLSIRKSSNIIIRTGSPYNDIIPNNNVPCRAGSAKLVIQANGNILPCEVYKHHNRCNWNLSIYNLKINEVFRNLKIIHLNNLISYEKGLKCPIHSKLRSNLMRAEHVLARATA